jgi:hypothetical protein
VPFLDPGEEKTTNDVAVWACALLLTGLVGGGCSTVPERFAPADPIDPAHVSHQILSDVLQASVHDGQVNYPAVQIDHRFTAYLAELDRVNPSLGSRDDRLAFWINAYNACAIQGILDGYSPEPYLGWYRFFKTRTYRIGGSPLNLSDVEHEILRKQFREPRIHFAIVCASSSCPKLAPLAYEGRELDRQLDEAARAFINDRSRNRFDKQERIAYLSKIFDWFEEDFAASAGSVLQFVAQYVHERELSHDLAGDLYEIKYLEYDWRLNGPAPKEAAHASAR